MTNFDLLTHRIDNCHEAQRKCLHEHCYYMALVWYTMALALENKFKELEMAELKKPAEGWV